MLSSTTLATRFWPGVLFITTAILLNKWAVEQVFSPDAHIQTGTTIAVIVAFEVLLALAGVWLLLKRPRISTRGAAGALALLVGAGLLAGTVVGGYGSLKALRIIDPNRETREAWEAMIASEELILDLNAKLGRKLSESVKNLQLPDHLSHDLFAEQVTVSELVEGGNAEDDGHGVKSVDVALREWPVAEASAVRSLSDMRLWSALLEDVRYFRDAKFYIVRGRFLDEAHTEFEADVGFSGSAWMKSGSLYWVKASQKVRWRRADAGGDDDWRIHSWQTGYLKTMESDSFLFTEVLDEALTPEDLVRARRSIHEELVLQYILDPENFEEPHRHFFPAAVDRHPGISVVDLDRDGYDDLFVAERLTRTMFFHNNGDGTFTEMASDLGLAVDDFVAAAIFADFDNDGDLDAILGRTLEPSLYLVNEGGRFVDRSAALGRGTLPSLVSSINAVDFDGDGLLDIYFSTYAAQMIQANEEIVHEILKSHLATEEIDRIHAALEDKDLVKSMNFPGPPNVLLKNVGDGRFERWTQAPDALVYRNTYQSTWSDFDGDGDADVYVANDFAPNNMLRNDGNGRFTDVTDGTGTADIGFGMGASWGDYDNDGRQDLYVSNMYSKAGKRITEQISTLDPRWSQMARGNSLFRNAASNFEKVSGTSEPSLQVEAAGWSWGGQFVDVDNDGFLDIYALSGHYTAPEPVRSEADT